MLLPESTTLQTSASARQKPEGHMQKICIGTVVECWFLTDKPSPSWVRPTADGWPLMWV